MVSSAGPHTYDVADLATVTLPGIETRVCPQCGEREAVILRMLKTASDARPNGRIVLKPAKMGP